MLFRSVAQPLGNVGDLLGAVVGVGEGEDGGMAERAGDPGEPVLGVVGISRQRGAWPARAFRGDLAVLIVGVGPRQGLSEGGADDVAEPVKAVEARGSGNGIVRRDHEQVGPLAGEVVDHGVGERVRPRDLVRDCVARGTVEAVERGAVGSRPVLLPGDIAVSVVAEADGVAVVGKAAVDQVPLAGGGLAPHKLTIPCYALVSRTAPSSEINPHCLHQSMSL